MRRRAKLPVLLLSAAVLAGAWLLAAYRAEVPVREAVKLEGEHLGLPAGSDGEITALSWSWAGQTVNLSRDGEGHWRSGDDEACPVDDERASALARAAAAVTASMALPDVRDLERYGLASPALTVVAATSEAVAGYDVGNMSVTGEYYLRVHGDDTVYRTASALPTAFRVGIEDLLARESVPEDIETVTELTVTSGAESYHLVWDRTAECWFRTDGSEPVPLEADRVRALVELLTGLELADCVTWQGAPEDFGLDEPQVTAAVDYQDGKGQDRRFVLEFGDYTEGAVYTRFAGSSMIYRTPGAAADGIMYPRWDQMTPTPVLELKPETLASLTVTLDGRTREIARLEEEVQRPVAQGESAVTVTDVIYSLNGWVLDTSRMNGWLESFSALTAEGAPPTGEGRETILTVTFTWKDQEASPFSLELRNYDSAHYLCLAEGERLLVPRDAVDELTAQLRAILKSE